MMTLIPGIKEEKKEKELRRKERRGRLQGLPGYETKEESRQDGEKKENRTSDLRRYMRKESEGVGTERKGDERKI